MHHYEASVCSAATLMRRGGGGGRGGGWANGVEGANRGVQLFAGRSFLNELAAEGMARERRYDGGLDQQQQQQNQAQP